MSSTETTQMSVTVLEAPAEDTNARKARFDPELDPLSKIVNGYVHDIFDQRCKTYSNSLAIDAWDGSLTYRELDIESTRVAALLKKRRSGGGDVVLLLFDKSKWVAISMLAALKAGSAFCLLDLAMPLSRLKEISLIVKASTILTASFTLDKAHSVLTPEAAIAVDSDNVDVASEDVAPPDRTTTVEVNGSTQNGTSFKDSTSLRSPEDTCYVTFTSGSTGKPKGIFVPHRAVVTSLATTQQSLQIRPDSRIFQFSSHAWEVCILDYIFTLLTGACICVPSKAAQNSNLTAAVNSFSADWMKITPSVARILDPGRLPHLKTLCLVGETIGRIDTDKWTPHLHLIGVYGPSESCGASSIRDFKRMDGSPSNIGISTTTKLWIVDTVDGSLVSREGQEGEVVLEGPCLSHGYLNQNEDLMKTFTSDAPWLPTSRAGSTRLYWTGDIVRRVSHDSLEFVGRRDTQIKLRGQRIELGEVECHTRAVLPESSEVVVELVSAAMGETVQLVAFVQLTEEWMAHVCIATSRDVEFRKVSARARADLEHRLPTYMIPQEFYHLYRLPYTMSGKIDRKSLRRECECLLQERRESRQNNKVDLEGVSDSDNLEILKRLCERILGMAPGTATNEDGWLRLGGDSLLAMKAVDQARGLGLNVSFEDFLGAETLSRLASKIDNAPPPASTFTCNYFELIANEAHTKEYLIRTALEQCRINPDQLEDLYPCTTLQMVSIPYMASGKYTSSINYSLQVRCSLSNDIDPSRFAEAWKKLGYSNPVLRTRLVATTDSKPRYYQAVLKHPIALDDLTAGGPDSGPIEDLYGLGRPLVRASLRGTDFIMLIHHLVFDGYSLRSVVKDLERAYQGAQLPRLSFSPFIQWTSRPDARSLQFWTYAFADFDGLHFPSVPPQGYMPVETACLQRILEFPPQDKYTPSNSLRLALAITMARHLGVNNVVFGEMAARRAVPFAGVSDMAFPTASILPVCTHVKMDASIETNLHDMQQAYARRVAFEAVEMDVLRTLSPQASSACDHQMVLIIQHVDTEVFQGMFKGTTTAFGQAPGIWSVAVEALLNRSSLTICLRIDEAVLSMQRAQGFLDTLQNIFNSIVTTPSQAVAAIDGKFDF